ncbi:hypothetical protein DW1_1122 [Proteiniborus sp. DW1]|uniref:hypothetical protein n=1 Tax=Proteiniborus sp. DW1 TaxID=1889883 RepID=UPI00092DF961|nr:hypothetical protein [Proteiniborus sp. DW1]SCG82695.1 hypothetical protein DW1_1122 [Proteiniborus sp. DW1]
MINREALEYLVGLGFNEDVLIETEKGLFSKSRLERVELPKVQTLIVSTLTSLIDYCKSNIDVLPSKMLIQVVSPKEVRLLSPLDIDNNRQEYIKAVANLPDNIYYDRFIDTEQFNIMLQSSFVDNEDKQLLLKFTGLIQDETIKTVGDDGVTQSATIKTGIAKKGEAEVPNPVVLAPYRTFPEIRQPASKFIFRMKTGPLAALYQADGGAWKNEAMWLIKEFLQEALEDIKDFFEIIS